MKKSDLKVGMIVKTREDELFMVMPACNVNLVLSNGRHWMSLDSYNDDCTASCVKYDIVKVYGLTQMPHKATIVSTDSRELLWEREEAKKMTVAEIEDILGYKIEVVSES